MSKALAIVVVYAAPGVEAIVPLALPAGATVAQAVAASGLPERYGLAAADIAYAIHGRRADGDASLADGDRVEITRPLVVDAKEVRRARAQGRRSK